MAHNRGSARRPVLKTIEEPGVILELMPDEIVFGENIRDQIDVTSDDFKGFVESIRREGQLQPGTISKSDDGKYLVETGNRRAKACMQLRIPFIATLTTGDNRLLRQLTENLQRKDLSSLDREKGVKALVEQCGSQADAARLLGKSEGWVSDAVLAEKLRTSEGKYPPNTPTAAIVATKGVPSDELEVVIIKAESKGGGCKGIPHSSKRNKWT